MGRGFIEDNLPASGRREFVAYSAFLTYRMEGGTLPVDQQPAWCPACLCFVLAERLPEVAELERSLAAVLGGERKQQLDVLGRSVEQEASELTRRIAWRRGRRSPPRCLHCGSDDVTPLPIANDFSHPATGERVVVTSSGFAVMRTWVAEFSPEGILLSGADFIPNLD